MINNTMTEKLIATFSNIGMESNKEEIVYINNNVFTGLAFEDLLLGVLNEVRNNLFALTGKENKIPYLKNILKNCTPLYLIDKNNHKKEISIIKRVLASMLDNSNPKYNYYENYISSTFLGWHEIEKGLISLLEENAIEYVCTSFAEYENYVFEIKEKGSMNNKKEAIATKQKLTWNGQSNILTHIFYELKKANGKDNKPLLNNTNDEIATFLKESFDCFENTKHNTIVSQLKKKEPSKKSTKKIEIWV